MGCFINELQSLMTKYNMKSINITANIDKYGKMHLDTYDRTYNEKEEEFITEDFHKPSPEELADIFRQ